MEKRLERILTCLIILISILFVGYVIYVYIKTPVNTNKYPVKITELLGEDVTDWEEYVKENSPTKLIVYVNNIETSEVPQVITDKDKIKEVLDIILSLNATGFADKFNGSSTRIIYYFEDETGRNMSFTFQDDLFKTETKRYYVDNISDLNSVEGINLYK